MHNWVTHLNSCNFVGQQCHSAGQRMMAYDGFHMHMYVLYSVPIPRTRSERQYKVDNATREETGVTFEIFQQMRQ